MTKGNHTTMCLSTQIGCAVDCSFCATAKMGFIQNLTVGEIIDQYLQLVKYLDNQITNVVFMGMGEPFLNYENSIAAAKLLNHEKVLILGHEKLQFQQQVVSKENNKIPHDNHPYRLAVSLNGSIKIND